jgi:tetratricopeptide (TPR) repeat protein
MAFMASTFGLFRGYEDDLKRARSALAGARFDEGLAILDRYKGLLTTDPEFMALYADILDRKGSFAEAEAILARLLKISPGHIHGMILTASTLTGLGRRPEAVAFLDRARAAHPANTDLVGAYLPLLLAERGPAVAMAALRAEHDRRTPPRRLEAAVEKLRQKALALHDPDELRRLDPDNLLELEQEGGGQAYSLRLIYEAFESIGCNCELGFVQRRSGAEPLSLLRWAAVTPEKLTDLLACDLEGYDNPAHYTLGGLYGHEFILIENVFNTRSHTGVNQSDITPEEFLARMTRRQGFLKRKFLADAAEGRKIFTYKADEPLTEAQMNAVEAQLVRLGVRQCLFVMPTADRAKAGTVEIASPHRSIGYLSAIMPNTQYEEWNRIAITVYDRFVRQTKAA